MRFKNTEERLTELLIQAREDLLAVSQASREQDVKQLALEGYGKVNRGLNGLQQELKK